MDWFAAHAGRTHSTRKGEDSGDAGSVQRTAGVIDQGRPGNRRASQLQLQQGRAVVWAPVSLVCGLTAYFSLPVEPPVVAGLVMVLMAAGLLLAARAGRAGAVGVLVGFALAGFVLGQAGTAATGTKVLPASTGKVTVSGWIDEVGPVTGKRRRMVVAIDAIEEVKTEYWPGKVRLSVSADRIGSLVRGDYVTFQAWLYPPLTPAIPGGWNYGRVGWFDGIGAGGRVASPLAKPGTKPDLQRWSDRLAELRAGIADRMRTHLPQREAGFAVALITGERSGLDRNMREALQLSGLAHILAISGLHMSLVAGGVFWLVRALLALWPMLALNYPVKKFAAMAALGAAGFYLMISGQAIATQRAFIMLSVMFLAVLLGRSAISMRNLAVAAIIVLLIAPQAVLTPSFQMSFLAVMGLIAGYEILGGWQTGFRAGLAARPLYQKVLIYALLMLLGLSTTTIIASAFTTLPAAFHFNRFAAWALPANLLAMPVVTFLVMPAAVASVCLMPFGLEHWPLQAMSLGLEAVQAIAVMVSGWPGATKVAGAMMPELAFLSGMGLCFLALWRGSLRRAGGGLAVVAGFAAIALGPRPDILIERTAATMAGRMQEGGLVPVYGRRGRFAVERWLLADGDGADLAQAAKRAGWRCADDLCRSEVKGKTVLWLGRKAKPPPDCRAADIVVSANPLRRTCGYPTSRQLHIDRFDVWRNGAHAVHITTDGKPEVTTARGASGSRAWVYAPVARRKILLVDPGPWVEKPAAGSTPKTQTGQ
ncbi:ComEC/Rec2 family competence protein [Anderseniella sp. Alg231-50]|uniref:ComEC/Rec2 family competence protein n=1 Tax=Anderseniella sp. Alg231-50 TaxID=1922226 RepID=UPI000D5621C5